MLRLAGFQHLEIKISNQKGLTISKYHYAQRKEVGFAKNYLNEHNGEIRQCQTKPWGCAGQLFHSD